MLIRIIKTCLILLLLIIFLFLFYLFNSPNAYITVKQEKVILENIFLGEYYLGFDKIEIYPESSHIALCAITHTKWTNLNHKKGQIILTSGINTEQSIWGSTTFQFNQKPCLLQNKTYVVSVWGNNGSGFSTRKNLTITIP